MTSPIRTSRHALSDDIHRRDTRRFAHDEPRDPGVGFFEVDEIPELSLTQMCPPGSPGCSSMIDNGNRLPTLTEESQVLAFRATACLRE
jgi:hypothetical protein